VKRKKEKKEKNEMLTTKHRFLAFRQNMCLLLN